MLAFIYTFTSEHCWWQRLAGTKNERCLMFNIVADPVSGFSPWGSFDSPKDEFVLKERRRKRNFKSESLSSTRLRGGGGNLAQRFVWVSHIHFGVWLLLPARGWMSQVRQKKDSFGTCCCALLSPWRCIDMDGQICVQHTFTSSQRRPPSQPRQNWIADLCAGHFPLAPIRFVTLFELFEWQKSFKSQWFHGV